ncbi:hypothetical protein QQF64_001250 [Cirrhinus molitorella]|uniref:Uncharacterized protein n=1 Tax=Cirrhinus molitorella TaxID=172907 RepID=A0ABR3P029_9TELE
MLQQLLEQRRPLTTMSAEMDLGDVMSHHQWELVQAIVKILQPFEEATRTVCEDVASLSSVIPCVHALKTALTNLKVDADVQALPEALKMLTTLQSQLAQRFQAVLMTPQVITLKPPYWIPDLRACPCHYLVHQSLTGSRQMWLQRWMQNSKRMMFLGYLQLPVHPQLRVRPVGKKASFGGQCTILLSQKPNLPHLVL